jgi:8-oxo-dGTP pyrophosphatase MutT (NUDIX family)
MKLPAADQFFEKVYNQKLLRRIEKRFGTFRRHHVDLAVSSESMVDLIRKMRDKPRRGEVVMVIPNEQGHFWLHTKAFYPQGIYRLMTGGLELNEKPDEAFLREVAEETGFKAVINRCLAVITYRLKANENPLPFVSYIFMMAPTRGLPQPSDPGEAITDFRPVSVASLPEVAHQLRSISGDFADWGIFRAVAHEVTYAVLEEIDGGLFKHD